MSIKVLPLTDIQLRNAKLQTKEYNLGMVMIYL